ncbi:MAG TPA: molecular chaperone DnaJ [Stellaceae bacterium]|nr:molecular chaperone DnaJ [Stellaceae bacterium]
MAKQDFYDLLGVSKSADTEELKRAYRKAAMQHHPDRNPGDTTAEQKFKDINEAYDVLKDDQKRAAYDRFGHAAFEQGSRGPGGFGFEGGFGGGFANIFEEMFGAMGGGRGQGNPNRGSDLRYNIEVSLEEAHRGKQTTVRVGTLVHCDICRGSGAEPGSHPVTCRSCGGHGRVRAQQGFFTIERTCPTCHGAGSVVEKPCKACSGQGRVRREKTLAVNIPPGVEDGTRIRLAGEGEAGRAGAAAGDLYIFVAIPPHAIFQRDGANVHCRVPIPFTTAALGGTIEVPTVEGSRTRVTVPAGTQSGHQFRLRGKGMTVLRSPVRGDMFIEAIVETPVNLTKRQQELLREFDREGESRRTSPQSEGFFARVREFFEDLRE